VPHVPYYESVFIARPDISAAQVEALTESLTSITSENGGSVTKNEYWGLKTLTYRIKKNRKGHYSLLNLDAPPAAVKELERNMLLNEDILRFMTIRVDELETEPSIMMRNKGARDDRPRRDDRDRPDRPAPAPVAADGDKPDAAAAAPADAAPADAAPAASPETKDTEGAES
jgi:small subunit ribosomal protein S6